MMIRELVHLKNADLNCVSSKKKGGDQSSPNQLSKIFDAISDWGFLSHGTEANENIPNLKLCMTRRQPSCSCEGNWPSAEAFFPFGHKKVTFDIFLPFSVQ